MELYHHGIKGQKWGVRHYQNLDGSLTPAGKMRYQTIKVTKGSRENSNEIYDTLDKHQKWLIAHNAKTFIKENETKYLVEQTLVKIGDTPVSAFDVWNHGNGDVGVSIQTRSGYQGKGYADKAVKTGLETLKKYENVKIIYWGAYSKNTGSRKLAENNGFEMYKDNGNWVVYKRSNK